MVPDMSIEVTGERFGGAYWTDAEFQVVFRSQDGDVYIYVDDELARVVTAAGAHTDLSVLLNTVKQASQCGTPGLVAEPAWHLSDAEDVDVPVTGYLDEVLVWLEFAAGWKTWVDGDVWEY